MHYQMFIEGPDVYQFEWPYLNRNVLGRCYVTIYLKGADHLTVVLTQTRTNHGISITNFIENLATQIYQNFLQPLGVPPNVPLWIEHYDCPPDNPRWKRVIFARYRQKSGYENPKWETTDPIMFDPNELRADTYWAYQIETVSETLSLDRLFFDKGECYQVKTGICSLNNEAQPDETPGEDGYRYCRAIARGAHIWEIVQRVVPEDKLKEAVSSKDLIDQVIEHWPESYGARPNQHEIRNSISSFGAVDFGGSICASSEYNDDTIVFIDGRHRVCVAHHLGIPVKAFIETKRTTHKE